MEAAGLNLVVLITAVLTATASTQANGVCNSCNCQFNNVQVLDQLVNAEIANTIGKFIVVLAIVSLYYYNITFLICMLINAVFVCICMQV